MAIKNKNSIFDLANGPVSDMETQQGPQFQRPTDAASLRHTDSLSEVPTTSPFQDLDGVPDSFYNTLEGTTNSPFQSETGDHMVDLLTKNAKSTNTGLTYTPAPNKSQFQDLNGNPGPQSQLPTDAASQKHINSLQQVPGFSGNSPFQDLNGNQGPQSQLPTTEASQKHIDSLQEVPGSPQNSPFQDLNGEPGPQFQLPTTEASQKHIDSLQQVPGFSSNSPFQDLNGAPGPAFDKGISSTLKQDSLANIYQSSINPGASFGAGQKGGIWPSVLPTPVGANFADLDGNTPKGYTNPETGTSF